MNRSLLPIRASPQVYSLTASFATKFYGKDVPENLRLFNEQYYCKLSFRLLLQPWANEQNSPRKIFRLRGVSL